MRKKGSGNEIPRVELCYEDGRPLSSDVPQQLTYHFKNGVTSFSLDTGEKIVFKRDAEINNHLVTNFDPNDLQQYILL